MPPCLVCLPGGMLGSIVLGILSRQVLLKLQCAYESPGDLLKTQILIQELWGGVPDAARPPGSQVKLMLPV